MPAQGECTATWNLRTPRYWASILAVAGMGIGLTAVIAWETYELQQKAIWSGFLAQAEHRGEVCAHAVRERQEIVTSVGLLYNASSTVRRDEFSLFAQSYLARFRGIQQLAWIPTVSESTRAQCELVARREGMERFQIVQRNEEGDLVRAPQRAQYLPFYFVEPYAAGAALLGFDLTTDGDTSRLLTRSRDTGQTQVAMFRSRLDESNEQYYMNVFAPVYDNTGVNFTTEGRRESLRGYVLGVFDLVTVAEEAMRMLKHVEIRVNLWHQVDGHRRALDSVVAGNEHAAAPQQAGEKRDARFSYEKHLPLGEGKLVIECVSTPAFLKANARKGFWWVIQGGLLATTALVAYVRIHLTRTAEVERQVSERTHALRRINDRLTGEICEREQTEAELRKAQKKLVEAAHRAGMADVATDVLHNVGNVLNSINVSTARMTNIIIHSRVASLARVADLLSGHKNDLGTFLTEDDRGRQIPLFLVEVSRRLGEEQSDFAEMLDGLAKNVQHIKDTITMQQAYAKVSGMEEQTSMVEIIEDAIQINSEGLNRHRVRLVREYEDLPPIHVNKQKVLQILVNLLSNGKYALSHSPHDDRILTVRLRAQGEDAIRIEVIDNGVGIAAGNLNRIFRHGFTTKKDGHGFGLHSGALAAREMGGTLSVHSDGLGEGAVFTLVLPMKMTKVTTCQTTVSKPDAC